MHKKFEIDRTKIKGGCHSGRIAVTNNSKNDLPLAAGWALFDDAYLKESLQRSQKWMQMNSLIYRHTKFICSL